MFAEFRIAKAFIGLLRESDLCFTSIAGCFLNNSPGLFKKKFCSSSAYFCFIQLQTKIRQLPSFITAFRVKAKNRVRNERNNGVELVKCFIIII